MRNKCEACVNKTDEGCDKCWDAEDVKKTTDFCDPVDFKYRDPTKPDEAKDCHKTCGEECIDDGN